MEGDIKRLKDQLDYKLREIEDWRNKLQESEKY